MFKELEQKLGIVFHDQELLQTAFVHRSFVNEHKQQQYKDNERLEFLGDAVLELIITEYLYKKYKTAAEGELTNIRSAVVRKENLAKVAQKLNLGKYLRLSRGEEKSGGRTKDYLLANTCEALIGCLFLDQGLKVCEHFVHQYIIPTIKTILQKKLYIDAKSALQEYTQDKLHITPTYKVLEDKGPDHDKTFTMGVFLNEKLIAKGSGSSKRKAEEQAAYKALQTIKRKKNLQLS
jgi:ribonuclease-3